LSSELLALTLAALLQFALFAVVAVRANFELGAAWFLSPRDREPDRPLSQGTARLKRAYLNQLEWIVPFAIGVTVVTLAGRESWFTAACAWVFLGARIAYVPAYLYGWAPGRSLIWTAGFLATLGLLLAALFGGGA
jgi:uncharacterized MAPEG superfamily protein